MAWGNQSKVRDTKRPSSNRPADRPKDKFGTVSDHRRDARNALSGRRGK